MSKDKLEQATVDAKAQIEKKIDEFKALLDSRTSDPDHFITLAEIEKEWAALKNFTNKTYSDMVSSYLSEIDERSIIKSKKWSINNCSGIKLCSPLRYL